MEKSDTKKKDLLKLDNQLCFSIYAASRLMIRMYQTYLDDLGVTYPQYLVLLILWEKEGVGVNEIASRLYLNTNTVTPLLKRMEQLKIIERNKCCNDERKVLICLTEKGKDLEKIAQKIPSCLIANNQYELDKTISLKSELDILIKQMIK
nr:MarR family transcriptional regulator [uncultured Marinifilum sp.]